MCVSTELMESYRRTRFAADTPIGRIEIRVGEQTQALDDLLVQYASKAWCFITAWNPGSQPLPAEENRARNQELRAALGALQLPACFIGEGVSDQADWSEESFLAIGVDRATALALGQQFGQNAVVWGQGRGAAELLVCSECSEAAVCVQSL